MVKKKKKKTLKPLPLIIIKVFLIIGIFSIFMLHTQNQLEGGYSNTASLLAVNEDNGEIRGGSIIDLTLETRPGNGEIYVNARPLKEIDTQLSIRNGHKTACQLFELDCHNYDYFFTFDSNSNTLQGPSATASIALLTAKTIKQERIDPSVTMTGSLNSAGVVGAVSGIPEKIEVAQNQGFDTVLIPLVSSNMAPENTSIEVKPVLDIFEVYNAYGQEKIELPEHELDKTTYNNVMSSLVDDLCTRSNNLETSLEKNYKNGSSQEQLFQSAKNNMNSSQIAIENENYYSASSFCFSANNNLQFLKQIELNDSLQQIQNKSYNLSNEIQEKYDQIADSRYVNSLVDTQGDLYIYLLLHNRIDQAKQHIDEVESLENETAQTLGIARNEYALAKERLETVNQWERFLVGEGEELDITVNTLQNACRAIQNDIDSLSGTLNQYEIDVFDDDIKEVLSLQENPYLCVYNGLELTGRINTLFFSFNIEENPEIADQLFDLTQRRIAKNSGDNFPLIPFIYYEYAQELTTQQNYNSALLYINFAQSFANLEFYLDSTQDQQKNLIKEARYEFLTHPLLLVALLLLLGFIR